MSHLKNSNPVRPLSRFRRVFLLHFKGLMTGRRGSEVDRLTTVEDVEDNPTTFVRLRRSTLHYTLPCTSYLWFQFLEHFMV